MKVVYAREPFPDTFSKAIFLAGPTPRSKDVDSWRPEALDILASAGYDGAVFVPENGDGSPSFNYLHQIEWEERGLRMADGIVFWVPRELKTMPAFTTNIEWGVWQDSGKCVLGSPADTPKMAYLQSYADKLGVARADTLNETIDAVLELVGEDATRRGGEREVPLHIWRKKEFQQWYQSQLQAGNRLDGAELNWQFKTGQNRSLFCWAMKVNVFIPSEDRWKSNEVIIARPDISAVCAIHLAESPLDSKVVLVREFRSPASTPDGFIHELPGGSSPVAETTRCDVAAEELEQETGVAISADRFREHSNRQCAATMLTHRASLFSVELTAEELTIFEDRIDKRFGEDNSERTYVEVRTIAEILACNDIDWVHVGMILTVLHEIQLAKCLLSRLSQKMPAYLLSTGQSRLD